MGTGSKASRPEDVGSHLGCDEWTVSNFEAQPPLGGDHIREGLLSFSERVLNVRRGHAMVLGHLVGSEGSESS